MLLKRIGPYLRLMRLHQPTGIWLLLWPCWWSIALATDKPWPDVYLLGLFFIGAVVIRGAGCVINDIVDGHIDAKVERTKDRPLASGKLTRLNALWLLAILLSIGLVVVLQMKLIVLALSLLAFIPVIAYPFMKRLIAWPQLFLGATFNLGAIVGWAAATGSINVYPVILYLACFFWTLGYDTIYAHQDKKDDSKIGVKSTAVSMGNKSKIYIASFYFIMILLLMMLGSKIFVHHNLVYHSSLLLGLFHLAWQVKTVNLGKPESCMRKFRSNTVFGWIIFFGILVEKRLSY